MVPLYQSLLRFTYVRLLIQVPVVPLHQSLLRFT